MERGVELDKVDRAIISTFEAVKDFAESDIGNRMSAKQLLAALTIAAVEQANRKGLSGQVVAATLRDVAHGVEDL